MHDLITLLQSVMALTVEEQGDKHITSSLVIFRLVEAKRKVGSILTSTINGERTERQVIYTHLFASSEEFFYEL